jgi:hypothetical protein
MGIAEFPPNSATPRQKAAGPEGAYVVEGEVAVQIEEQPAKVFRAGETFQLPADAVRSFCAAHHPRTVRSVLRTACQARNPIGGLQRRLHLLPALRKLRAKLQLLLREARHPRSRVPLPSNGPAREPTELARPAN